MIITITNLGTAGCYAIIGGRMLMGVRRQREWVRETMTWLYATFILSCGISHLAMGVAVIAEGHMMIWPVAMANMLMLMVSAPIAFIMLMHSTALKHLRVLG